MSLRFLSRSLVLCALLACAWVPVQAEEALILPQPALLRAQKLLRQAEQDGAAAMQPRAVLAVQEKINAAWSAYHQQVEEEADEADDDEAILARQLADEAEVDAELLLVTLRAQAEEARLDGLRASRGLSPSERLTVPPPTTGAAGKPR